MKKLAIITTHPIQYYAPVFKLLTERARITIKVFYTAGDPAAIEYDHGFDKKLEWDIPLLDGYAYDWVENSAAKPGSYHFRGIVNPGICAQITAWAPDALLVFGWAYSGHLKVLRYFYNKVPVYFKGDSTLLNKRPGIKRIFKYFLLRWVYGHVDYAFFNGSENRKYFKNYGLKDKQLVFAPHAIDNERFGAEFAPEAEDLRLSIGINKGDILILYAGKFDPVKNLSLLLRAFGGLKTTNVHLLLAGSGVEESQLKRLAAKSLMSKYIHFTAFKNQAYMPILYQSADLVCLTSKSETWGLAINEAMACKKAVLVSDKVGCAEDLVKPGINGEIFKSGNASSLLAKLLDLTYSKKTLEAYGAASGRLIQDWNFTKVALAIENQIEK